MWSPRSALSRGADEELDTVLPLPRRTPLARFDRDCLRNRCDAADTAISASTAAATLEGATMRGSTTPEFWVANVKLLSPESSESLASLPHKHGKATATTW